MATNKEIKIMKDVNELILNPSNMKKHNERSIKEKMDALATFGQVHPIVIDKNNIVLSGNGRLIAAKELGWKEIWVTVSDLEGSKAIAYSIADNKTSESSEWKFDELGGTLNGIIDNEPNISLSAMGFEEYEFKPLLNYSSNTNMMAIQMDLDSEILTEAPIKMPKAKENSHSGFSMGSSLSPNSFESKPKKEKKSKDKLDKDELVIIDKKNNSTTILVTESQNKIIEETVGLVRTITGDKTLTTGECLQILCDFYTNNQEELGIEDF